MANLLIKAPQLGIIDPIVDIFFAKKRIEEKSVLYEKLNEASLYQKVCIVVNVPQRIATLLDLKLKLYYCDSRTKENFVFNVQQNGNEVNIIETKIDTTLKNNEIIYMAIAEVELYTQDKIKMKILEKLSPLNIFMQLTWGVRDFNPEYSLKLIKEFAYKDSYFYRFFGEGKWFRINKSIAPWMEIAKMYIGTYEDKSSASNPVIQGWIDRHNQDFNLDGKEKPISSDNEPWCGIFVYNMLVLSGVKIERGKSWEHPSKASFYNTNWKNSVKIKSPQYGAIAKMKWSHVTFIYNFDDTFVWVLGGNQPENGAAVRDGVIVNIVKYKISQVEEMRMPEGY